ncbi:MAG TPA: glycosyltransferase family 4 protein [Vicinamibacterales bacterium]|nr:glycosyltransferase family 4 protein [Vicinamibacterales bacterium]
MRIGIVGPPFIAIPPARYGGTELFIANLARGLHARGHDVTVYGNGDSRLPCRVKSRYPHTDWPVDRPVRADLKNIDHTAWAIHDAAASVDVIHLNDVVGAPFTRFVDQPVVLTIHHPHEQALSEQYVRYPELQYVAVGKWLAAREPMSRTRVVHHGIPLDDYLVSSAKADYVAFLGRMAPCKGPHLAVEVALRAGIRLKLAGEIQPIFRDYWDTRIAPFIDGRQIEYVGEVNLAQKNALLSRARALLFPIQWEEPFGLVMIESMACGTPVLAFAGGAVEEVVRNGINGWICSDVADMAARATGRLPESAVCRDFVARHFSIESMIDGYLAIYDEIGSARTGVARNLRTHGRRDPGTRPVLHSGDGVEGDRASCGPSA